MKKKSIQFLEQLVNTPSPTGRETRGQRVWLDYVSPLADETFHDAYGNCAAILNQGGSPRLMLAAHADEIALTVNYVDDQGFIYVRRLGGVDAAITKAQRVVIHTRSGPIKGVVGNVAPHLTKQEGERKVPKIEDLFIDIGAANKKETQRLVRVGDAITIDADFEELRGQLAVARAFDNRIGTFAVAETLRLLAPRKHKLKAEVIAVSNIMEEIGLLGARQIAYSLKPDLAIVIDVTHATDYPTVNKAAHGEILVGRGPVLTHGTNNHPSIVERLESVAAHHRLALQHEAVSSTSGTDADAIFWTRGGIPTALVSLPNRYMHSPVELISLADLEAIPELLAHFALGIRRAERFSVKI